MELLLLGIAKTLMDSVAATSDTDGDIFAVPVRCTSITWQSIFGSAPAAVEMQLLGSLDGTNFVEIDNSTQVSGEVKTIETNVTHIRPRIDTITDGADVSFLVVCKDL